MNQRRARSLLTITAAAVVTAACAVRPAIDPRTPNVDPDVPVTLRVCIVADGGAHLVVGDQVEFTTGGFGGLRIRHIPGAQNNDGAWNRGAPVRVRSAVLIERVDPQGDRNNISRFVPVGRFPVRLEDQSRHQLYDFLVSKTTTPTREHQFPECIADIGDDEVLIRGVLDEDRHGGTVILR